MRKACEVCEPGYCLHLHAEMQQASAEEVEREACARLVEVMADQNRDLSTHEVWRTLRSVAKSIRIRPVVEARYRMVGAWPEKPSH